MPDEIRPDTGHMKPNRVVRVEFPTERGPCVVEMSRRELVRRAMAVRVAETMAWLIREHHRTEAGRRVELDHQWIQVYSDPSPDMRMLAPAQCGKTLYELVKTMAQIVCGLAVGWVMPNFNKMKELIDGKLNPTIRNTELYQELRRIADGADTVHLKTFGRHGRLYIVTANSETQLTSFSADCMHIDERDFCNREYLPMYPSRMNFSPFAFTDEISTPTIEGSVGSVGQPGGDNIHSEFLAGDQWRYFSQCPHCAHEQILEWDENVVVIKRDDSGRIMSYDVRDKDWSPGSPRDIRVCCAKCKRPFDRLLPGRWKCLNPGARMRSRWIERLASPHGDTIASLLERFDRALGNPSKMQQFQNMDLGRPFAGGMMRFEEGLFMLCEDETRGMMSSSEGPCTIGIDVNRPWLDVQISRWVDGRQVKVYAEKIQGGVPELLALMSRFGVIGGVIDNNPEQRFSIKVQEEALEQLGVEIVRCNYATNEQSKDLVISERGKTKISAPRLITVNRTVMIDTLYESMLSRRVSWFRGWREAANGAVLEEFRNPVRVLERNDAGNERFVWQGQPDHQLHAGVYDLVGGDVLGLKGDVDRSEVVMERHTMEHSHGEVGPHGQPEARLDKDDNIVIFQG